EDARGGCPARASAASRRLHRRNRCSGVSEGARRVPRRVPYGTQRRHVGVPDLQRVLEDFPGVSPACQLRVQVRDLLTVGPDVFLLALDGLAEQPPGPHRLRDSLGMRLQGIRRAADLPGGPGVSSTERSSRRGGSTGGGGRVAGRSRDLLHAPEQLPGDPPLSAAICRPCSMISFWAVLTCRRTGRTESHSVLYPVVFAPTGTTTSLRPPGTAHHPPVTGRMEGTPQGPPAEVSRRQWLPARSSP